MENRSYYNKTAVRIISMILVAVMLITIPGFKLKCDAVATEVVIAALFTIATAIGIDLTYDLLESFVYDMWDDIQEGRIELQEGLLYALENAGITPEGNMIFCIPEWWWIQAQDLWESIFGTEDDPEPIYVNAFKDTMLRLGTSYSPEVDPIRTEVLAGTPAHLMIGETTYTYTWYADVNKIAFRRENVNYTIIDDYDTNNKVYGVNYNRVQMGNPYITQDTVTGGIALNGGQKMLYNPPPLLYMDDEFVGYGRLLTQKIYREGSYYDQGTLSYTNATVRAFKNGIYYNIWAATYTSNETITKNKFNYELVANNGEYIFPAIDWSYFYGGENEAINEIDDGEDIWLKTPGIPDDVITDPDTIIDTTPDDVIIDELPETITIEDTNIENVNDFKAPTGIMTKFPFCIPHDLYKLTTILEATPEAPVVELPFIIERYNIDYTFEIDFSMFDDLVIILRYFVLAGWVFGLIMVTRHIIKG